MATYGPNSPNGLPFTGFSPTLGVGDAVTPSTSGAVYNNGIVQQDYDINRALATGMNRATRALFVALLGAAAGGTALSNRTWVQGQQVGGGSSPQGGGIVPLLTFAQINRVTTATDVANLQALITFVVYPPTYPLDVGGNGGGGKLGF